MLTAYFRDYKMEVTPALVAQEALLLVLGMCPEWSQFVQYLV